MVISRYRAGEDGERPQSAESRTCYTHWGRESAPKSRLRVFSRGASVTILIHRLFAFFLDWVVLFLVLAAPQLAVMYLTGSWFLDENSSNVLTWGWVGISVTLPSLIYFVVCDASAKGMTVGKHVFGLSVRATGGSRVKLRQSLGRNVVKLIPWEATHIMVSFPEPFGDDLSTGKNTLMILTDVLLVTWLLVPLYGCPGRRALHDRAAGTAALPLSRR
jgi:uncharacterized RDD family membrane protein YckC